MLRVGFVAIIALIVLCNVLLGLSFTYGSLQAMSGNMPDVKTMLLQVNRPIGGRLLILGVVQTVTISAAAVLIVPGLYLLALWMVSTPVMMVEQTDLVDTFRRSAELTRGRRWRALIAVTSCLLIFIVIFPVVLLPLLQILGISSESIIYHAVTLTTRSLASMVLCCMPPVLYVFLRKEKESATVQDMVATFD